MRLLKEGRSKIGFLVSLFVILVLFISSDIAADSKIYEDGIYRYVISDTKKKEATLVGFAIDDKVEEIVIPGKTIIGNVEYTVTRMNLYESIQNRYDSVKKIIVSEDFKGEFNVYSELLNVKHFEFKGNVPPSTIYINYYNTYIGSELKNFDVIYQVPEGKEEIYRKAINLVIMDGDERETKLEPTIISSDGKEKIEFLVFLSDDLLCQVIKSGASGNGEVKLIASNPSDHGYLKLQDKVKYNDYEYKITKLGSRSLAGRAQVISIPDTVKELESNVFSQYAEIIFLSKNIKEIPSYVLYAYYEDNESHLKYIYVPEGVTTIKDNAFNYVMVNTASVILPKTIKSIGKDSLYGLKLVTFLNDKPMANIAPAIKNGTTVKVSKAAFSQYRKLLNSKILMEEAKNVVKATSLAVNKKNVNINTATTYTLVGTLSKGSNETVFWNSTDNQIFDISSKGVINPKRAGTAYAVAYTRTSGLHQIVKVTVTDTIIKEGIFSFKLTDATKRTVRLIDIKPTSNLKKITIPETVVYNKKTYQVTSVAAEEQDYIYTPVIKDTYRNNKIEEIIFPKSITDDIGYLGEMNNIKSINFKGTTTPARIFNWWADGGILAFKAKIYVPKGKVNAYLDKLPIMIADTIYTNQSYSGNMLYNVLEVGTTQNQWFIKDGIMYRVKKKAGTNKGTVEVHGADIKRKTIKVGGTVTDGKYKYTVTSVATNAFKQSFAENITLGDTITKVGSRVFNQTVKKIVWSKNAKSINTYLFTPSPDLYETYQSVEIDNMVKEGNFYSLTSFTIPEGVTTIGNVFRYGFENLKTLTVPKSATSISKHAFDSVQKVVYSK